MPVGPLDDGDLRISAGKEHRARVEGPVVSAARDQVEHMHRVIDLGAVCDAYQHAGLYITNGGIASRISRRAQSAPIPVGPYILWPENA